MKKFGIAICIIIVFILSVIFLNMGSDSNDGYLRFHVRANSNSSFDQYVKYDVKDKVVNLLSSSLKNLDSYEQAYEFLSSSLLVIEEYSNLLLREHNCDYTAHVKIDKEYFEEKQGDGFVMAEGVYEALIINLGEGNGNNWWCLVYPSLSFIPTNGVVDYSHIVYKSKLVEIYNNTIN